MNKIQTTKANSTLRRFFDRLGGGNVKALGYNKTASVDGNGGGGSSEEAQKLFDAMFGQTPYVLDDNDNLVPFSEFLSDIGPDFSGNGKPLYKEKQPAARAGYFEINKGQMRLIFILDTASIIMVQVDSPDGPLYQPVPGDVDLTNFPIPTVGHPTVLTGVTIPDKDSIDCVTLSNGNPSIFTAEKIRDTLYRSSADGFALEKENDVWVWKVYVG